MTNHYPTSKHLPPNGYVYPSRASERLYPHPDATPLGTYGRNKRTVFRREDMREAKSRTAWKKQDRYVPLDCEPVDVKTGCYCTYPIYCDWQTTTASECEVRDAAYREECRVELKRMEAEQKRKVAELHRMAPDVIELYRQQVPTDLPLTTQVDGDCSISVHYKDEHLADYDTETGSLEIANHHPGKIYEACSAYQRSARLAGLEPYLRKCRLEGDDVIVESQYGWIGRYNVHTAKMILNFDLNRKLKASSAYKAVVPTDLPLQVKRSGSVWFENERLAEYNYKTGNINVLNSQPGLITEAIEAYRTHPSVQRLDMPLPKGYLSKLVDREVRLVSDEGLVACYDLATKKLEFTNARMHEHQAGVRQIQAKYPWLQTG